MEIEPYYLVIGPYRSGTSMMMRSLRESGLPINFILEENYQIINSMKLADKKYAPNPQGFFEKGMLEPGKAAKRLLPQLKTTRLLGPTHIVRMVRQYAERKASLERWGFTGIELMNRLDDRDQLQDFYRLYSKSILSLTAVAYPDMVEHPLLELNRLVEAGWNLPNIEKGAMVPTAALYRHRIGARHVQV